MALAARYELYGAINGLRILFTEGEIMELLQEAAEAAGLAALELVGDEYPPEPPGPDAPSPLVTPKQIRWWWAMMHRIATGEDAPESLRGWKAAYRRINGRKTLVIKGGYKRTGTLVRSINYDAVVGTDGVTISVGPTMARMPTADVEADYANYVIDLPPPEGKQARIHQDRWTPLVTLLSENQSILFDTFMETLVEAIRRKMAGTGYLMTGLTVE